MKDIQILSVMSELGAGTRGASLGIDALQVASLKYKPEFFKNRPIREVKTLNQRLYRKDKMRYAKRLDAISQMYQRTAWELKEIYEKHKVPVVFSGDHSNAGGTIAGIKKAFPKERLGVIWIDAHTDLHTPYTSPSGNVHGMPLSTALHEDNLENKNNEPNDEVKWYWNEMKGSNQRIHHEDLFFIGVRSSEEPEQKLREKHNIPNVTVDELREKGAEKVAAQALDYLKDCDIIYISFDVDSLDPSISHGTGTPVEHGLWEEEASTLLLTLVDDPRVCCLETTEINPLLDTKNSTAEMAFRIIRPVIEKFEKKSFLQERDGAALEN